MLARPSSSILCEDVQQPFRDTSPVGPRLWVEGFTPPYEPRAERWWVFDRQDRLVADATIPERLTVEQIDADKRVDVQRDSLRVSYVQVGRLERWPDSL